MDCPFCILHYNEDFMFRKHIELFTLKAILGSCDKHFKMFLEIRDQKLKGFGYSINPFSDDD
jgi:hypothetical protein